MAQLPLQVYLIRKKGKMLTVEYEHAEGEFERRISAFDIDTIKSVIDTKQAHYYDDRDNWECVMTVKVEGEPAKAVVLPGASAEYVLRWMNEDED